MRMVLAAALFLLTAAAGPCSESSTGPPRGGVVTVRGTLTDEGVECPALRDRSGKLYTLTGSLGDFHRGDKVCVHGRLAEVSYCMQGITVNVEWIKPAADCP